MEGDIDMRILAHRGYWNSKVEKNSSDAIRNALENGYSFESDVRDYMGKLVLSHNIADDSAMDAEKVFQWLHEFDDAFCFAINIKADGLQDLLYNCLIRYDIDNYFAFDMSVPQMIEFRERGIKFFTRLSEVEKEPCLYEDASGVWVDGFWSVNWITKDLIEGFMEDGKDVCLVSPELHGREYMPFWNMIREWEIDMDKLLLCTDFPDEAKEVFL